MLDTAALQQITSQAREIHPGRTLLVFIATLLYGLGWVTAKSFTLLFFVVAWACVAVRAGWRDGRKRSAT